MLVEIPGHGRVQFPDSMNEDDIVSAIKKITGHVQESTKPDYAEGVGSVAFGPSFLGHSITGHSAGLDAGIIGMGRFADKAIKGVIVGGV